MKEICNIATLFWKHTIFNLKYAIHVARISCCMLSWWFPLWMEKYCWDSYSLGFRIELSNEKNIDFIVNDRKIGLLWDLGRSDYKHSKRHLESQCKVRLAKKHDRLKINNLLCAFHHEHLLWRRVDVQLIIVLL